MTGAQAIGGGQDGNAWNPANWQITYERQGLDEFSRIELSPTDQKYYSHTYRRDWQTGAWTRDGVLYFGEPIVLPVSHEGGKPDAIQMTSDGTITVHVNWISPLYPAPQSVILYSTSSAGASATETGASVVVRNAFNDLQIGPDYNRIYRSEGAHYRKLQINGGHGEISFSMYANATASAPFAAVSALASDLLSLPTDRMVAIPEYSVPNFYYNGKDPSVFPFGVAQNLNPDPSRIILDVAVRDFPHPDIPNKTVYFYATPVLTTMYLGNWYGNRTHQTSTPPSVWVESPFESRLHRFFSDDEIAQMMDGNPVLDMITVIGDDILHIPKEASLLLRFHAPFELITPITDKELSNGWSTVDQFTLYPGMTRTYTESLTQGWTTSESINYELSQELSIGLSELVQAKISPSVSFTGTQTASLAIQQLLTQSYTNFFSDRKIHYKIEQRPYKRKRTYRAAQYNEHGFNGFGKIMVDYFQSGNKDAAEQNDAELNIDVTYTPIQQ